MRDRIIENRLGMQVADRALAREIYGDLRDQLVHAQERRYDSEVSVAVAP